jgi:cell wall-associated NlpC family hydrolase
MNRRQVISLLGSMALTGCGTTTIRQAIEITDGGDAKRNELVLFTLSQVGLPYRWGGNAPNEGFDCSGLVVYAFQQSLQVAVPRTTYAQARIGRDIPNRELRSGDLVFFNTMRQRFSHVGIYVGDGRFVHAPAANERVRLDRLNATYWQGRFDGARRLIA